MKSKIGGALEGVDGLALVEASRAGGGAGGAADASARPILWLVEDEIKAVRALASLQFFTPEVVALHLPAYDCLPYDSFSPSLYVAAARAAVLAQLAASSAPVILVATLASAMQKVPSLDNFSLWQIKKGEQLSFSALDKFLLESGYQRGDLVAGVGQYAVRGGLLDVYPASSPHPVRIDFFGDEVEGLRFFDADSQLTLETTTSVDLPPASELIFNDKTRKQFEKSYIDTFGFAPKGDGLYQAIHAGHRVKGIEHYVPFFYPSLKTIFELLPQASVAYNENLLDLAEDREVLIDTCYQGRKQSTQKIKVLEPRTFYLTQEDLKGAIATHDIIELSPFAASNKQDANFNATPAYNFSTARAAGGTGEEKNLAGAVLEFIKTSEKPVWFAISNPSQGERLRGLLPEGWTANAATAQEARSLGKKTLMVPLDIERGIELPDSIIFCEEDILGKRTQARRRTRRRTAAERRSELMLAEALRPNDLITHRDHGIGRFEGLRRIEVADVQHDCFLISYAQNDKLYIPVENADLISRYGSHSENITLDRLGGQAWHTRKQKVERDLWEMAGELIEVAASRQVVKSQPLAPQEGLYEEFCRGFEFEETPDQQQAITDVLEDLGSGKTMDRLICGDVGFGKTEIALRAAFIQAMGGKQVAVVVPTTLLCRQHHENFKKRFENFPLRVGQLSRLVPAAQSAKVREELANGTLDIVIGTHALMSKQTVFQDLGLAIIDEEQHFGVQHKEQLKELRADIHILTLTATPIPRTLQLALSGAREISLIGDPPIGRLAVHNFIGAFDELTTREALLREKKRGGQSFFITPRIAHLEAAEQFLQTHTPHLRVAFAHGKLTPRQLEEQIGIFYDGAADVLLSTPIVEAGLDIVSANTLVVWHAHLLGLAQLHQLRGRVGRGKQRAYAYFTLPKEQLLTPQAEERLLALQATQFLGAGFSLAARDLDSRGAGNLLGRDQSGHIKEIGYELYQTLLAKAVAQRRTGEPTENTEDFLPRIRLPAAIMIPESYIPDQLVRLTLYRRTAALENDEALHELQAEIEDRFGKVPMQLTALFYTLRLKLACRAAGVEHLDIGGKLGLRFYQDKFSNLRGLVRFIESLGSRARLLSDHRLVIQLKEKSLDEKFETALKLLRELAALRRAA